MLTQIAAAALAIVAASAHDGIDTSYDVTDYVVSPAQMQAVARDGSAPVRGRIVDRVSVRPGTGDATVTMGTHEEGRPFLGRRVDVRTDGTVLYVNSSRGAPASVEMRIGRDTGTASGTYVLGEGGRREHHVVTVKRIG